MSAPAWLRCPEPHAGQDPDAIRRLSGHGFDPAVASEVVAALISEGRCPACPALGLEPSVLSLYGREVPVGRCRCCRAAWRVDAGEGWEALELGRLVAAPPEMGGQRLYGLTELAGAAGISPNLAKQWQHRGKLPPPDAVLAMGPVWLGETVERWLRER